MMNHENEIEATDVAENIQEPEVEYVALNRNGDPKRYPLTIYTQGARISPDGNVLFMPYKQIVWNEELKRQEVKPVAGVYVEEGKIGTYENQLKVVRQFAQLKFNLTRDGYNLTSYEEIRRDEKNLGVSWLNTKVFVYNRDERE